MVRFSYLSNNLVPMMWNFIELEAIYTFSTASKKVYNLTHELLREHYGLKSSCLPSVTPVPSLESQVYLGE